ncbi:MAG: hypothetical protein JWP38_1736 [Herbaspirillum sp.]|nr:hypothetical protein [Herbaspirillum sp.]
MAAIPEDVTGVPFESVLNQHRLDLPTCLHLGSELARLLAGLHAAHVIHRDIRPASFILDAQRQQLFLRDLRRTASEGLALAGKDLPGDWAYVSPEQTGRINRPLDERTDFYSLGVLLYRMLTGQLPFAASDPLEWIHCHIACNPPPPCDIAPEVPQAVSDIVMRLMAKLPEERYRSAQGLQADLDSCLAQWQACRCIEAFPLGTADVSGRFQIPHKLYGREPEGATLLAAFDRMTGSGQPALVTVSGYSGIGKSSLVHELQRPIVRERGYFIYDKFDQYQRDIPYATITQAFRELVQQLLAKSAPHIAHWRQQIQAAVGGNGQLIVDVLPQVELIIGPQAPVSALPPTEAQHRFRMVFRQFVMAFTCEEHPLVLFLDDLQWIDAASLALIEHLLTHPETCYLLLIGAYRDNEVSAAHPLMTSLETIRRSGTPVTDLQLAPLSAVHLNQLVADTLHAPPASCKPLTHLICERTEGNPFFFIQFLDALHKEGLLRLDAQHRAWQWDLDQIKAQDFADNVVDLMVGKLRQLPVPAQQALQFAACLGNTFDLRHLALVGGPSEVQSQLCLSEAEVEQGLAAAVRESLIVRTHGSGKFLHDRIQQAAYSLIPEERRTEVHLRIGCVLLASMTADELAEHLFDVANQFNRGAALLVERDEKAQVAALDLRAGRKAKASTAYASACVYLAAGMALLDASHWSDQYELMFSLWLERAECEFLTGCFDQAERLIQELLRCAASKVDQAAAYHLKVQLHVVKSENPQAVDSALTCLRLFDIDLPAHPTREQVQVEFETVWRNLEGRSIESLINLPLMTDPKLRAAMNLFSALFDAAYFTDRNLLCLQLCRMVNISLKHGTSGAAAHACGFLGFILGPVFHRYHEGYRFAKLGYDLVEKHRFIAYQTKVYLAMAGVAVWTQPIASALDFTRAAFRTAIETGDLAFACYSVHHINTDLLLRSDPLDVVWCESERGLDFARKARFRDVEDTIVIQQHFISTMQGRSVTFSSFNDMQFDEAAFEAQLANNRMSGLVCEYWILKLKARFLTGHYAEALAAAEKARAWLWVVSGLIQMLDYFYYTALTVAALYKNASAAAQVESRDLLTMHREQLCEWAENYPPTFRDKHALVSAEIARIEGRGPDAMQLYEEAIQSARENGFVQNEAIAYECASAFYRTCGVDSIADMCLRQARDCYARWGADGKVRQLDERIPQLQAQQPLGAPLKRMDEAAQLDLLSVAKASQAISSLIVLDELVDTLMRIVLENAGAQSGCLILVRQAQLSLVAETHVAQHDVRVHMRHEPSLPAAALPESILNYVQRCQEKVLLPDAAAPHPFASDPYFARRRTKSLCCLPIVRQRALVGLLYLENNLVTHAFTPDRVAVMELLASQAAISLENAQLYGNLQRENSERRQAEAKLQRSEAFLAEGQKISHTGSWSWHLSTGKQVWSEELYRLLGFEPGKVEPTFDLFLERLHAEDRPVIDQILTNAIRERSGFSIEFRIDLPDGSIKYLQGISRPIVNRAGDVDEFIGTARDITERKRAQDEHAGLEQRLRQAEKMEAVGRLAGGIAHDFNNVLAGILAYGEMLFEETPVGSPLKRYAQNVLCAATHGRALVEQILAYSRSQRGKRAPIDIASVVAETLELVRGSLPANIYLEASAPESPLVVIGDATQLHQVVMNLCSNAIQAMSGGGTLRVALESVDVSAGRTLSHGTLAPGRYVCLTVLDSGSGMDEATLSRIFEPFFTTKDIGRGTGLGLSLVYAIVTDSGGAIEVKSAAKQGSTFTIYLAEFAFAAA